MNTRSCPKCSLLMARCDFKYCPDCGAQLDSSSPSNAATCSPLHVADGDPYCRKCGGLGTYEKDMGAAVAHLTCPCTYQKNGPLRVSYSRAEIADKLKDWMIELWGDSPKNLDPEQRDKWHRDNGLIYHFIYDHFPENADGLGRRTLDADSK